MRVIANNYASKVRASTIIILLGIISVTLLIHSTKAQAIHEDSLTIVLKAIDYDTIQHIEFVPKPLYKARELSCSEIAKELLLMTIYGTELPEDKLSFILACKRECYFSQTPSEISFDPEATLYATWLLKMLNAELEVDASFLLQELKRAETFDKAFYIIKTLKLLGYNISESMIKDFDLGYATAWIRNSTKPSLRATAMWLCLFKDFEKAKWLLDNAQDLGSKVRAKLVLGNYTYKDLLNLDYSEWSNIETLIIFKPVFINATIVPAIVVKQEPKIVNISIIKWPNEVVENYEFTWFLEEDKIVSTLRADNRVLTFEHYTAREENAWLKLEQIKFGLINVTCIYKPPYQLQLDIGGLEFKLNGSNYEEEWSLEVPLAGEYKVKAVIESPRGILIGEGTIRLEASFEKTLLDYAWIGLPLLSTIIALCSTPNRRRKFKLGVPAIIVQLVTAYQAHELLKRHSIGFTLISGVILLIIARLVDKEAFNVCLDHIIIITALCTASMLTSNPMVLLLGGIGSGLFLASALLYPSERERTERLYKATMIAYALGILVMGLVCRLAVDIANLLCAPDEGFIDSIRVQAMFIANLVALSPIVSGIIHLVRLVHAFERAREVESILKSIEE